MSVNRQVATQAEVLVLGTHLVLRLNYSAEVARSSSQLAKIYGWRHKSNVYVKAPDNL